MNSRTLVMGIVNRTPDSFYDGGRMDLGATIEHAQRLAGEGADILDIGGVKAGPGPEVSEAEELDRLIPAVEAIAAIGLPISVETGRPGVVTAVVSAGASIINDVTGLADPGLAAAVATSGAGLVVMHHGGQIRGRPRHPSYVDVLVDVMKTFDEMCSQAESAGVPAARIMVDPGLDFGKTTFHSLELVRRLDEIVASGRPVLVAPSRKDIVGETLDLPPEERLEGSLALVALSVSKGAAVVRVHDVQATVRTVQMVEAVMGRRAPAAPLRGLWD